MNAKEILLFILFISFPPPEYCWQQSLELAPEKEATLYETSYNETERSNGKGTGFLVGYVDLDGENRERRAMIKFNVSGLWDLLVAEATPIISAELRLTVSALGDSNMVCVEMYSMTREWGYGNSDASKNPTQGVPAQIGDATWNYAFYNSAYWDVPGGDFVNELIAEQPVSWYGTYTWTSATMASTIVHWVQNPESNHGLLLKVNITSLCNEGLGDNYGPGYQNGDSAKIFFSSHAGIKNTYKPTLVVYYDGPLPWWMWVLLGSVTFFMLVGLIVILYYHCNTKTSPYDPLPINHPIQSLDNLNINNSIVGLIDRNDVQIQSQICMGRSGPVYKGILHSLGSEVITKHMYLKVLVTKNSRSRGHWLNEMQNFTAEIKRLCTISHPNVLPLLGICIDEDLEEERSDLEVDTEESCGTSSGELFPSPSKMKLTTSTIWDLLLITEYMPRGNLCHVLFQQTEHLEKIRIVSEIAQGMVYIHKTWPKRAHGDLKLENVVQAEDGTIKICDYGLSRLVQKYGKTTTTSGTPHYLAPEVIQNGKISEKSDIYSYGIILWEIYMGARPYPEKSDNKIMWDVVNLNLRPPIPNHCHPSYKALIEDCLHRDPSRRPNFKKILVRLKVIKKEMCL